MPPLAHARAFSVHIFTAAGAALALVALIYAVRADWTAMFLCLGVALLVNGIDGTIARRFRVAELLPRWSGDVLDLVVDFTTYVFVPAYALAVSGLLPEPAALPAAVLMVITGALYFADRNMKTEDNYFRGFPALMERGGVLSVLVAAAAVAGGGHHRGAGDADLRPLQVHPSDAGDAAARAQYSGPGGVVGAGTDCGVARA